jgi:hypothetical protein
VGIFNVPLRSLVISFLVVSHLVPKSSNLLAKLVFNGVMHSFMGLDGFKKSLTD